MEKKPTYIIQSRKQPDYCNICGKMAFLTWDHIPPKSLLQEPNTYANTLFHELPSPDRHMRQYQNGIKYQSICSHCNNDLVGQYDADLSAFSKGIISELNRCEQRILNHEINHVNSITVTTKINRILRAICGHFLAMKNHYDDENIVDCYGGVKSFRFSLESKKESFQSLSLDSFSETVITVPRFELVPFGTCRFGNILPIVYRPYRKPSNSCTE